MRGPYTYLAGNNELWRWYCSCGMECERYGWELHPLRESAAKPG